MDEIIALVGYIGGFFDWIKEFFTVTIVELLKDFTEWLMIKSTVAYIDMKITMLEMAWSVASGVLDAMNIGPVISSYASSLDSSIGFVASAIGLFDAFNMVVQAMVSSFVLKIMRF